MAEASIDLGKYPWCDKHAEAVCTVAGCAGLAADQIVSGVNAAVITDAAAGAETALRKHAA